MRFCRPALHLNARAISPFSRWREKAGDEGASQLLLCLLALTLTLSRWREKAGDEGASELLLCLQALTLTLSRMREREPFSAVSPTCASPQHPRDRPLLPLAGEGGE
ncbi:hypothetical protein C1Y43_11565 [Pantoea sp. ICBG 828]|nr:hypothetical protein C1Y43_11565 [Pantoea sp. ICBG 828]